VKSTTTNWLLLAAFKMIASTSSTESGWSTSPPLTCRGLELELEVSPLPDFGMPKALLALEAHVVAGVGVAPAPETASNKLKREKDLMIFY
jgi:hypothetical protein